MRTYREDGKETFGSKFRRKAKAVLKWGKENPELAALVISGGVTLITTVTKLTVKAVRSRNLKIAEKTKTCRVYDHRSNMFVYLKKPMNKEQLEEFSRRQKAGERTIDILISMGLVK